MTTAIVDDAKAIADRLKEITQQERRPFTSTTEPVKSTNGVKIDQPPLDHATYSSGYY